LYLEILLKQEIHMKKILLKSLLLLMLLACKKEVKNDTKHISDDFAELLTNYNEEGYLLNPISATKAGDNRFNDQFPNFLSEDYKIKKIAY